MLMLTLGKLPPCCLFVYIFAYLFIFLAGKQSPAQVLTCTMLAVCRSEWRDCPAIQENLAGNTGMQCCPQRRRQGHVAIE